MPDRLELAGEPEVIADDPPADLLALRDPRTGATLDQLSTHRQVAHEILDARITILETARKRAIRITYPSDWNLYKDREGVVIGYLCDAGCERVRDILGIEVFNVSRPERVTSPDGGFLWLQTADGRSKFTTQVVENMEGGRSSTEDFCRGVTGPALDLLVRKATRANLDGNIARELMGMKSVPLQELQDAWSGTNKDWNQCRKARGFGSQEERLGAAKADTPDVPPPTCPVCKDAQGNPLPLEYRAAKGNRAAFYGCRFYSKHEQTKVIVDAAKWAGQAKTPPPPVDLVEDAKRQDAELAAREAAHAEGR